jgi:hypothetical protein
MSRAALIPQLDLTSNDVREKELRGKYERIVDEGRGDTVEWLEDEEAILSKAPHLKGADIKVGRAGVDLAVLLIAPRPSSRLHLVRLVPRPP